MALIGIGTLADTLSMKDLILLRCFSQNFNTASWNGIACGWNTNFHIYTYNIHVKYMLPNWQLETVKKNSYVPKDRLKNYFVPIYLGKSTQNSRPLSLLC